MSGFFINKYIILYCTLLVISYYFLKINSKGNTETWHSACAPDLSSRVLNSIPVPLTLKLMPVHDIVGFFFFF